jgi:hypothetical protein
MLAPREIEVESTCGAPVNGVWGLKDIFFEKPGLFAFGMS